jgi:hypothetical protein
MDTRKRRERLHQVAQAAPVGMAMRPPPAPPPAPGAARGLPAGRPPPPPPPGSRRAPQKLCRCGQFGTAAGAAAGWGRIAMPTGAA